MWSIVLSAAWAYEPRVLLAPDGLAPIEAPPPRFPALSPPSRCLLRVEISAEGVPGAIEARDCPAAAGAVTKQAVSSWRWPAPTDEAGVPAAAAVLLPIAFTPKGSVPVPVPDRCLYRLDVASTGAVRVAGEPVQQCEIWAPSHLGMAIVPSAPCEVGVDTSIVRETEGWLDKQACPAEAWPVVEALLARSLFASGRAETAVVVTLPPPGSAPRVLEAALLSAPEQATQTRMAAESASDTLDPRLETKDEPVPKVDLSALLERGKDKPAPAPAPP